MSVEKSLINIIVNYFKTHDAPRDEVEGEYYITDVEDNKITFSLYDDPEIKYTYQFNKDGSISWLEAYEMTYNKDLLQKYATWYDIPDSLMLWSSKITSDSSNIRELFSNSPIFSHTPEKYENLKNELIDTYEFEKGDDSMDLIEQAYSIEEEVEDIDESIEKHDELNPKLWNEDNTLREDVRDVILQMVDDFLNDLREDEIEINVKDIKLVGSNCSYNYTKDSDLDVHIVADTDSLKCPYNLYPLLYSAYRSLWNNRYDPEIYGVPVEIFVETSDTELEPIPEDKLEEAKVKTAVKSNGVYSILKDEWIKEPVQSDIPDLDEESFNKLFKEWEDKYFDLMLNFESPEEDILTESLEVSNVDMINDFIEDLYDLRKSSIANDGEYGLGNLVFKEFRNLGYLDNLKELKNKEKSKELSLY